MARSNEYGSNFPYHSEEIQNLIFTSESPYQKNNMFYMGSQKIGKVVFPF